MQVMDEARYCPLCRSIVEDSKCPEHGVPTVPANIFETEPDDLAAGTTFSGAYRIEAPLGEGGVGRVYRATQLSVDRAVALKTLHADLVSDAECKQRFYREARSASRLCSPHVVRIHDFGVDEATRTPFIAMELLEGSDLLDLLFEETSLDVRRACGIIGQVTEALGAAKREGIIHRDLKPENIFITRTTQGEDFAKVMDFGIATATQSAGDRRQSGLTAAGATIGTPTYMSPEQVSGKDLDFRSDLYALGCILYELLTGAPPFQHTDGSALLMKHLTEQPPELPMRTADEPIPEALRQLYAAMVSKNVDDRPGSIEEVHRVLSDIRRREPVEYAAAPRTS